MTKIPPDIAANRRLIVERLRKDLIGPREENEVLQSRPSDVWLTGILWPQNTEISPEEDERLAVVGGGDSAAEDADDQARPAGAASMRRPSTAGVSFAARSIAQEDPIVKVRVAFGLYSTEQELDKEKKRTWVRRQVLLSDIQVRLSLQPAFDMPLDVSEVPGLRLNVRVASFPNGRLATVTLVNASVPDEDGGRNASEVLTLFQVELDILPAVGTLLVARPSRRSPVDDDDRSAALLYRNAREYAAGHTCSADWSFDDADASRVAKIRIEWLPEAETAPTSSEGHSFFRNLASENSNPFSAAWLAEAPAAVASEALETVCGAYERWIDAKRADASLFEGAEKQVADRHLLEAELVLVRMRAGKLRIATDATAAAAFRLANLAMVTQNKWKDGSSLNWRPFQLGFLLLALESAIDGNHPDRDVMDLLWFPTGGGKTEAYLALVALVAFHRRLSRNNPDDGAGVATIMRYTLRLLTTQQFIRAAALMTACEAIRRGVISSKDSNGLGEVPFSVGLWVGENATPNTRELAFRSGADTSLSSPRQLSGCPCCRQLLDYKQNTPSDAVTIWCRNTSCTLHGKIPISTVDEDIYEERPTLLIGTVDKFAQIVRKKETARLFAVGSGAQPQLILQDELHLIAGPLGTLAGLYETALDLILSADGQRPKIIGSTATIRRASEQVSALFDRQTCQFPPPGLDSSDSGFAVRSDDPGRLYVGITTAGRSAKFTLQAVAASLLQTAFAGIHSEARDNYWTLVSYFNSLRELGGALVLFQDDVADTVKQIAKSRGEEPRKAELVEELTSRRSQIEIRDLLNRLEQDLNSGTALDVVLATNMLSVGVDIRRLGLMLVNGQPKTIAEYIQSTSRVGRGKVAGLVTAVLNAAKPRDRSHYETFRTWHETLYRDVEASSVTPYASRARDRALHAVLVAVVRHCIPGMLDGPTSIASARTAADILVDRIVARAHRIDPLETAVRSELTARLDRWERMAPLYYWRRGKGSLLQGAEEAAALKASGRSLGQAWPTPNSMRGVEPVTPYRLAEVLRGVDQNAQ